MFNVIRRHSRKVKPLGGVIDVWRCLSCGCTVTENTDSETFSRPAPLECKRCPGEPDMQARRYYAVRTDSSANAMTGKRKDP